MTSPVAASRMLAGWFLASALLVASPGVCAARGLTEPLTRKLDPRLVRVVLENDPRPISVWVTFRDKGEDGPAGLSLALDRAVARLTPRARARRERAGVWPLVDALDLPVHEPYLEALRARGFVSVAVSRWLNRAAFRVTGSRLGEIAELPFVDRITPVQLLLRSADRESRAPSGETGRLERASVSYGLTLDQLAQIKIPAVHDSGYIGMGVLVCMLDEGFNFHDKHEALRNQIIPPGFQRDFVDGDTTVTDTTSGFGYNHGTWTFGVIAGDKPGTYVGAAYGAQFALARTENGFSEKPVEMLYWGMGAEWADSLGADIISSSLGYFQFDPPATNYTYQDMNGHTTDVSRAAEIAASKGILVVNSVGNEGNHPWRYLIAPADVDGDSLIAVGAVDASGDTAAYSSVGPSADGRIKPDLCARGSSVPLVSASGDPQAYLSGTQSLSGTSFSAPLVAGLAACILQARPHWTPREIIRALRISASRASHPDEKLGFGVPNGLAVLRGEADTAVVPHGPGPLALGLSGPNPLRANGPALRISIALTEAARGPEAARLRVLDVRGRAVAGLWSGTLLPGRPGPLVLWNGKDDDGRSVSPGLYWIALSGASKVKAERVVWLR